MIKNQTGVIGILTFSAKPNLLCLLRWIWISHFPLESSSTYFGYVIILNCQLIWSYFLARIADEGDVSSANNFALDAKSLNKSLLYIRKNIDPNIESFRIPVSIATHEDITYLEQVFALVDVGSLSNYLKNYLIRRFL